MWAKFISELIFENKAFNRKVRRYINKEYNSYIKYKNSKNVADIKVFRRKFAYKLAPMCCSVLFLTALIANMPKSNNKLLIVNETPIGVVNSTATLDVLDTSSLPTSAEVRVIDVSSADVVAYDSLTAKDINDKVQEQAEIDLLNAVVAEQEERAIFENEELKTETEPAMLISSEVDVNKSTSCSVEVKSTNLVDSVDLLDTSVLENENKIQAYAVYIEDEYIGAVTDVTVIQNALDLLKAPYISDDIIGLSFDKSVTYDKEITLSESMMTDPESIVDKLLSTEGVSRYYEVQPGDCPSIIADKLGMTTDALLKLPVTFNGEVIPNLNEDCRVGMQIQYQSERKFIHVLVKKDTTYQDMIEYDTIKVDDDTLPKGTYKVTTEGVYGVVERTCREVWHEDTVLSSKELSVVEISRPVTEVIHVGTKVTVTPVATTGGGNGTYFFPTTGKITAYMGDGRGHKGIDIAAPYGTPIYAAASGTISTAVTSGWGSGYGKHILIKNDDGNSCMYGHMSYLAEGMTVGTYVVKGQLIGYVGSTGDSTGNHLHFEVRDSSGNFKNPLDWASK